MSTKSLINEKPKAEPTTHQLQGSKEKDQSQDKYQDQCHEEVEVEVDHLKRRQHERLQEKAAIDNYKQLCTTIPVNTPLKFKQNYTGNTRFRESVYGEAEASNVHPKRTKEDQEIVGEGCIRQLTSGSKDRHCKVSTRKGLRDRRVRLSAETAIDFYDVQDRLGFDRPSKAIDWLMKEAEAAIEALGKESPSAQLPYHSEKEFDGLLPIHIHQQMQQESKFYSPKVSIQDNKLFNDNPDNHFSFISLLCGSTSVDFPNYQHGFDPRIRNQTQDLCLSLQSFEDDTTILKQNLIPYPSAEHQHSLTPGSIPKNFNKTSNPDWFQKMIAQNSSSKSQGIDSVEGNMGPFLEHNQISLQRESIQSTMLPSINSPLVELDYPRIPTFNASSATSAGALYNHFQISQDVRGREETIKSTSISSSATSSFLQYQDFQNQEFDSSHKTEELK